MASLRCRIWDRCTRRIPGGTIMPPWAVALNVALFPVRAMGALIYRRTYPFDIWTQTWNIHGARFSDRVLMVMAGSIDEGWYKFSRASDGIVIVERRMEYTDFADWQKKEVTDALLADEPAVPEGREPAAVTGQPSDQELLDIAASTIEPYERSGIATDEYEPETESAVEAYGSELIAFARAVLARWGNLKGLLTSSPTADGEVAELVEWLQEEADDYECIGCEDSAAKCDRAAELLQRGMEDLSPIAYELLTLAAELES